MIKNQDYTKTSNINIHLGPTETICLCVTTPIPRLGHLQPSGWLLKVFSAAQRSGVGAEREETLDAASIEGLPVFS